MIEPNVYSTTETTTLNRASLGRREPLLCPHEDCRYRDNMVNDRPGIWLRLNEPDARAMVAAVEGNRPHRAILILKQQPWYPDLCKKT